MSDSTINFKISQKYSLLKPEIMGYIERSNKNFAALYLDLLAKDDQEFMSTLKSVCTYVYKEISIDNMFSDLDAWHWGLTGMCNNDEYVKTYELFKRVRNRYNNVVSLA